MEETQVEEKKEPREIVVRNPHGQLVTRLVDEKHRFVKKKHGLVEPKELKKAMHKIFISAERGPDGKPIKGAKTRWRKVLDALIDTASYTGDEVTFEKKIIIDGEEKIEEYTKLVKDPKLVMAQVQAAKLLIQQFIGKEPLSPEDRESSENNTGIKIVVIPTPELMHKEVVTERKSLPNVPAFVEAEVIQQN